MRMYNNGNQQAYDRGVSMFSPDGRLYQVEYAREAVKRGSPSIAIRTVDGIVLGAQVSTYSPLRVEGSIDKIHKVYDSVAVSSTGHVADGRVLVDNLQVHAQQEEVRYGEPATVATLAENVAGHIQETTQAGGRRPYGTSLILAGVDSDGASVYEIDPSGTASQWNAVAVGQGRQQCMDYLSEEYTEDMTLDDGIALLIDTMDEVTDAELGRRDIDVITIPEDNPTITPVEWETDDEFETYLGDR